MEERALFLTERLALRKHVAHDKGCVKRSMLCMDRHRLFYEGLYMPFRRPEKQAAVSEAHVQFRGAHAKGLGASSVVSLTHLHL